MKWYCHTVVAKEKVTLALDAGQLEELSGIAGARSLSAAVDEWLAELERAHGPVPAETLEWAAQLVEQWDAGRSRPGTTRRAG